MVEDRLAAIKRTFNDAEAADCITLNSPTRWLIAEVERLREINDLQQAEINGLCIELEQQRDHNA